MYGVSVTCKENYAPNGDCYCKPGFARYYDCGPCIPLTSKICQKLGENVIPSESKLFACCSISFGYFENFVFLFHIELCAERQNEQFSSSGGRRCRDTCIGYTTIECMATIMPIPSPYLPVCECKEGYARLPNGQCVDALSPECYEYYKPTPGK